MTIETTESQTTLLDGLLDPFGECFTLEVARKLVNLHASPAVIARLEALADKCNEGALTPDERAEYESYVHVNDVLTMLKVRARQILQATASRSA